MIDNALLKEDDNSRQFIKFFYDSFLPFCDKKGFYVKEDDRTSLIQYGDIIEYSNNKTNKFSIKRYSNRDNDFNLIVHQYNLDKYSQYFFEIAKDGHITLHLSKDIYISSYYDYYFYASIVVFKFLLNIDENYFINEIEDMKVSDSRFINNYSQNNLTYLIGELIFLYLVPLEKIINPENFKYKLKNSPYFRKRDEINELKINNYLNINPCHIPLIRSSFDIDTQKYNIRIDEKDFKFNKINTTKSDLEEYLKTVFNTISNDVIGKNMI
jgi:hypothetical protein